MLNQPLVSPPASTPMAIPAFSSPSCGPPPTGPPKVLSAISGNKARGIPKTIAMMSTTKVIRISGWNHRNLRPSNTFARSLSSPSGGIGGNLNTG